jgi:hypothetical protein
MSDSDFDGEEWKPSIKSAFKNLDKIFALDGETIKEVVDNKDVMKALNINNRRVALDEFGNGSSVSTVFLCIDHNFMEDSKTPILFETMAWYKGMEYECRRYPTVESALTGHREVVESIRIAIKNNI